MKDFWSNVINFLNEYGILAGIIGTTMTAIGGTFAMLFKWLYKNTIGDKIKLDTIKEIARVVVKFVEQVYKDIHGEEKLDKALEAFAEMLNNKGITISDLEMRVYLESALAEFNEAFNKEINKETSEDI